MRIPSPKFAEWIYSYVDTRTLAMALVMTFRYAIHSLLFDLENLSLQAPSFPLSFHYSHHCLCLPQQKTFFCFSCAGD